MDGDAILWVSLALIVLVMFHQYRGTLSGMLFQRGWYLDSQPLWTWNPSAHMWVSSTAAASGGSA